MKKLWLNAHLEQWKTVKNALDQAESAHGILKRWVILSLIFDSSYFELIRLLYSSMSGSYSTVWCVKDLNGSQADILKTWNRLNRLKHLKRSLKVSISLPDSEKAQSPKYPESLAEVRAALNLNSSERRQQEAFLRATKDAATRERITRRKRL